MLPIDCSVVTTWFILNTASCVLAKISNCNGKSGSSNKWINFLHSIQLKWELSGYSFETEVLIQGVPQATWCLFVRDELQCARLQASIFIDLLDGSAGYGPSVSAEAIVTWRYLFILLPQRECCFTAIQISNIKDWELLWKKIPFSEKNATGKRKTRTSSGQWKLPLVALLCTAADLSTCLAYRWCRFRIEQY